MKLNFIWPIIIFIFIIYISNKIQSVIKSKDDNMVSNINKNKYFLDISLIILLIGMAINILDVYTDGFFSKGGEWNKVVGLFSGPFVFFERIFLNLYAYISVIIIWCIYKATILKKFNFAKSEISTNNKKIGSPTFIILIIIFGIIGINYYFGLEYGITVAFLMLISRILYSTICEKYVLRDESHNEINNIDL